MVTRQEYEFPAITELPERLLPPQHPPDLHRRARRRNCFATASACETSCGRVTTRTRCRVGRIPRAGGRPVRRGARRRARADRRRQRDPGLEPLMTGVLDGLTGPRPLVGHLAARWRRCCWPTTAPTVTKIEPPGGDPFARALGLRVWQRGKSATTVGRSDVDDGQRDRVPGPGGRRRRRGRELLAGHDDALGIDYETLLGRNPRLVYCSITGYGSTARTPTARRYDALVAARTGHQLEARGVVGGTIARLAGAEGIMPGVEAPDGCWDGADRRRARCSPGSRGSAWPPAYLATLAISAALRARELTGRGQRVADVAAPGRAGHDARRVAAGRAARGTPTTRRWIIDPRAPQGLLPLRRRYAGSTTGSPLPGFVLGAIAGRPPRRSPRGRESPRARSCASASHPEDMILLHHYTPLMAEAVAALPVRRVGRAERGEVGVPVQPVRSPEEALLDPLLVADGCVVEVDDPELGAGPPGRAGVPTVEHECDRARGRGGAGDSTPTRSWPGSAWTPTARGRDAAGLSRWARRSTASSCSTSAWPSPGRSAPSCSPISAPTVIKVSTAHRRLLDDQPHRDVLQPGQAQRRHRPQGAPRASPSSTAWSSGPTSSSTTCATTPPSASASTTSRSAPSTRA